MEMMFLCHLVYFLLMIRRKNPSKSGAVQGSVLQTFEVIWKNLIQCRFLSELIYGNYNERMLLRLKIKMIFLKPFHIWSAILAKRNSQTTNSINVLAPSSQS